MDIASIPLLLKLGSIVFGVAAVWPAASARKLSEKGAAGEDRGRKCYLLSYALTSVSILLFCAIGFLE